MKYCTDDGKHIFDTEQELFDYEKKVKAEKEKRVKLAEEKQKRKDEIIENYEALRGKIADFHKDYHNEPIRIHGHLIGATPDVGFFDWIDNLFR